MESVIAFLETMPFWYWWVLALAFLGIEMMSGSTYFLWPAISSLIAGLVGLFPFAGWQIELLIFAAATIALALVAPPIVRPWLHKTQADHFNLNENAAQKVGRNATVDADFTNGSGKVHLGDTLWLAESESGENHLAGAQVVIARVEGTKLIVHPRAV